MQEIANKLGFDISVIQGAVTNHIKDVTRMDQLYKAFKGEMTIQNRKKDSDAPNNKYMANHPKYITTIVNSYFIGNAPKYMYDASTNETDSDNEDVSITISSEELGNKTVAMLQDFYRKRHVAEHDLKMGKNMSIAGKSYELLFASSSGTSTIVKLLAIDPRQAFLIKDNTIERNVVAGIYYFTSADKKIQIYLYTDTEIIHYEASSLEDTNYNFKAKSAHTFGGVPLICYYNNDEEQGDFEQVLSIADAYNILMSDRINDKEQFVDAILVITGGRLPKNWSSRVKKDRLLSLPKDGSRAEWLTRVMNEADVENLRKAIIEDISRFSFVPNINDESFAGNSSGVAMSFKMIGIELLIKEKETNFTKGLRLRMKRLFHIWDKLSLGKYDYETIDIEYTHTLPTNFINIYDVLPQLRGLVSDETLLSKIDFVKNPQTEIERVNEQKENESKRLNQGMFGSYDADIEARRTATKEIDAEVIADEEA